MFNKISEKEFEKKLNILKNEVDAVMYHLYTELAIHAIATKDKQVLSKLNLTPIFWNTTLNSLQTSIFITLGRIFDPEPSH
ncbi:MAG: hypothetical protein RLZZ76_98, partial [Candidatus Parcubacteria bacterium]